jgi:hypothetical protein
VINFTVTKEGLEGQLLGEVVKLEKPDLEWSFPRSFAHIMKWSRQTKSNFGTLKKRSWKMLSSSNILMRSYWLTLSNQPKITSAVIKSRVSGGRLPRPISILPEKIQTCCSFADSFYTLLSLYLLEIGFHVPVFSSISKIFSNYIKVNPIRGSIGVHSNIMQNSTYETFGQCILYIWGPQNNLLRLS